MQSFFADPLVVSQRMSEGRGGPGRPRRRCNLERPGRELKSRLNAKGVLTRAKREPVDGRYVRGKSRYRAMEMEMRGARREKHIERGEARERKTFEG